MKRTISRIIENRKIGPEIFKMTLSTTECGFTKPGQFAMIEVPDRFLKRPISVSEYSDDHFTIIYKVVGEGTEILSNMKEGEKVKSLTGCGNGYDIDKIPEGAYIIGGGIGIPPMLGLMKELKKRGGKYKVVLGYNTKNEIFLLDEFRKITDNIIVMTADGSFGKKGFVTDAAEIFPYACACGPLPMLKALDKSTESGQFSLEARMGCGFGACMGFSIKTKEGPRRVCKEGPVFDKEVLEWQYL